MSDTTTTPEPADEPQEQEQATHTQERKEYVEERETSTGDVEPSDDSERTVGRRPGSGDAAADVPEQSTAPPESRLADNAQDDGKDDLEPDPAADDGR